ncbi:hypothetical protein KTH73_01535 [Acinetobacter courvalinii]|jgi:hypothetical protein|uniref:Uncharacterized protein n=1 Tax=Acinetobacter courvalinii TaxID=280147 RepID=N9R3Y0_9GAMM|nr:MULTISPECIES: hypothetical protein [Acinetobacter]EXB47004.1 hypothetical protein J522_2572 [Acinetobacter baumannii 146457]RSN84251.1 hypothetical protein EA770_01445 [Acinetobacter baumannii]ENX05778.1 hypothetical protein F898_02722 [Acinetobacter courvalinii]ENX37001.1 hypothetical protein F888_02337 [Acinetobacter courvalinii]EYT23558.1 hypothetical protein J699_00488 [Acinetobacter sp. 1000160]
MPIITLQDIDSGEMIKIRQVVDPKVGMDINCQVKIIPVYKWLYLENGDLLPDKLQDKLKKPIVNQMIDERYLIYKIDNQP